MGRQEGLIQLTGSVGNLSFYKSQDGYLVRKKSGVSRERIMSDRAYVRTRENIAEFARGARATKQLRRAFYPLKQEKASLPRYLFGITRRLSFLRINNLSDFHLKQKGTG